MEIKLTAKERTELLLASQTGTLDTRRVERIEREILNNKGLSFEDLLIMTGTEPDPEEELRLSKTDKTKT